jgi:hypothetical protein
MKDLQYLLSPKKSKEYHQRKLSESKTKLLWLVFELQYKERQVHNFLNSMNLSDDPDSLIMAADWLDIPISDKFSYLNQEIKSIKFRVFFKIFAMIGIYAILIAAVFMGCLFSNNKVFMFFNVPFAFVVAYFTPQYLRKIDSDVVSKEIDIFIKKQKEKAKIRTLKVVR